MKKCATGPKTKQRQKGQPTGMAARKMPSNPPEKTFYENEEKYKILAESSQTGIYIHQDRIIVYANRRFADLHGYSVDEMIGMNYFDLSHPEERAMALKVRSMRLRGELVPESREIRRLTKDGKALWCEVVAVPVEYNGKPAIMGNMVNISERKRKENILTSLNAISLSVNQSLKLDQVLNVALDKIMALFDPYAAHIRLFDNRKQRLLLAAHRGLSTGELRKLRKQLRLSDSIVIAGALKTRKAMVVGDATHEYTNRKHFFNRIGCPSVVCIILFAKGKIQGSMSIHAREPGKYSEDDAELFTLIGNQIGVAIENARLYQDREKTIEELASAHEQLNRAAGELEFRVRERTTELLQVNKKLKKEIAGRRKIERDLEAKSANLEEINIALKILLKKRDEERAELEEKVLTNVKQLIAPVMGKLRQSQLNNIQATFLDILNSNLNDIVSSFSRSLSMGYLNFTPSEIQIANMLKQGKTTKMIAELLALSPRTIETHRKNIRRKLGLTDKKSNLMSYLMSIQ